MTNQPIRMACSGLLTTVVWALCAAHALAQTPDTAAAAMHPAEAKAWREFQLLDANRDGQLSRAEVRVFPRLAEAFDEVDTNHDGLVSWEEVKAYARRRQAQKEQARSTAAATANAAGTATAPASAASAPAE